MILGFVGLGPHVWKDMWPTWQDISPSLFLFCCCWDLTAEKKREKEYKRYHSTKVSLGTEGFRFKPGITWHVHGKADTFSAELS